MSIRNARLTILAAVVAGAIAIPAAAFAYGASPTTPAPPDKTGSSPAPSGGKTAGMDDLAPLAASAGISESRLQEGLAAAKQAGGDDPQGVTALASAAGVSAATAQRLADAVFGTRVDRSLGGPASITDFARRLGVDESTAQRALQRVFALSGPHGVDPHSAAFAGIAHDLGITSAALAAALDGLKQAEAGK